MTEWVEQWICIRFYTKLERSSTQTIQMTQKATAVATGDWQLHHDKVPTHASHLLQSFLAKHQITQVTQPPYRPDLVPCDFWLYPKTKITFEREEISDPWWDSGKYNGAAHGDWENCVRSQRAYFEGDWGVVVLCTMFPISSSINVSIFHITWLDTFWTDHVYMYMYTYMCIYVCMCICVCMTLHSVSL